MSTMFKPKDPNTPITAVWLNYVQDLRESVATIKDFGGVGDNATDNAAAFALAEASAFDRVYLSEGTYFTTTPSAALTKFYHGPGKIRTSGGDNLPGRFTFLPFQPSTGTGTGYTKFFTSDNSHVQPEYFVLADVRTSLTQPYYSASTTPHLQIFDNRAGYSGTTARLTAIAALGATQITVNSAAGFTIGGQIGFNDGNDNITNTRTITNIVGNVISWVGGLIAPAPYAIGSRVTKGTRTMSPQSHLELQHRGGGDAYLNLMRVEVSYVPTAGQDHVFYTATGGFDGGDIVASTDGVYLTGREITFDDTGHDIAVVGDVRTFLRANGTGAREAFWVGALYMSAGAFSADAAVSVAGLWKVGLDLARADVSGNGNCAIGLKADQRIYFDNSGNGTKQFENWGSVLGTKSFGWESSGSRWSFKDASTTWLTIANQLFATNGVIEAGSNVSVPTNGRVHLEGRLGDTYFTFNGTNVLLFKNGVQVASW